MKKYILIFLTFASSIGCFAQGDIEGLLKSMSIPQLQVIPDSLQELDCSNPMVLSDNFVGDKLIQLKNFINNRYDQDIRYRALGYLKRNGRILLLYDMQDNFILHDTYLAIFQNDCQFPLTIQMGREIGENQYMNYSISDKDLLTIDFETDLIPNDFPLFMNERNYLPPNLLEIPYLELSENYIPTQSIIEKYHLPNLATLPESIEDLRKISATELPDSIVKSNLLQLQNGIEEIYKDSVIYHGIGYWVADSAIYLFFDCIDSSGSRDIYMSVIDNNYRYPETLLINRSISDISGDSNQTPGELDLITFSIEDGIINLSYSLTTNGRPWAFSCSENPWVLVESYKVDKNFTFIKRQPESHFQWDKSFDEEAVPIVIQMTGQIVD